MLHTRIADDETTQMRQYGTDNRKHAARQRLTNSIAGSSLRQRAGEHLSHADEREPAEGGRAMYQIVSYCV